LLLDDYNADFWSKCGKILRDWGLGMVFLKDCNGLQQEFDVQKKI
tara:strand:- start:67121 stop:67255 length:135 start_codon:yes stop_codon:yes gene_type:complete